MLCMSEDFRKRSLGEKLCLSSLQQYISDYIFSVVYKELSALPPLAGNTTSVVLANKKMDLEATCMASFLKEATRSMTDGQHPSFLTVAATSLSSADLRGPLQPERETDLVFSLTSMSINRVTVSVPDSL